MGEGGEAGGGEAGVISIQENAGSTYLTNAPRSEQSIQGGVLNAFFSKHGAYSTSDGYFYFEVQVINYVYVKG